MDGLGLLSVGWGASQLDWFAGRIFSEQGRCGMVKDDVELR
jgi:hypothetical protein